MGHYYRFKWGDRVTIISGVGKEADGESVGSKLCFIAVTYRRTIHYYKTLGLVGAAAWPTARSPLLVAQVHSTLRPRALASV